MPTTALPERYRKARNIDEGYEVEITDHTTGDTAWYPVISAFTITSPAKVTSITIDVTADPNWPAGQRTQFGVHPDDEFMSRRPASAKDAR